MDLKKIPGICGILAPIVTFSLIFLAIYTYPSFSWTNNCLSALGVVPGNTGLIYNTGLILGGLLALVFAFGLSSQSGEISAAIFILVALSLAAIGVFPENTGQYHLWATASFFVLFPISMIFAIKHFWAGRRTCALFTLALVMITILGGILNQLGAFGPGCAIAEMIGAVCVGAWALIIGIKMLR